MADNFFEYLPKEIGKLENLSIVNFNLTLKINNFSFFKVGIESKWTNIYSKRNKWLEKFKRASSSIESALYSATIFEYLKNI